MFGLQARIKKIMQTDEEIGKVAAAVPVIICILLLPLSVMCLWAILLPQHVVLCIFKFIRFEEM